MLFLCWAPQAWTEYCRHALLRENRGTNALPVSADYTSFDTAEETVGFLDSKHMLPAHIQLFIQ